MFWDHEDGEWCCWLAPSELQGWHPPFRGVGVNRPWERFGSRPPFNVGSFHWVDAPWASPFMGLPVPVCHTHRQRLKILRIFCPQWHLIALAEIFGRYPFIWAQIKIRFPWFSGSSFSRRDSGPNIRCVPLSMCWLFTLPLASPSGGAQASIAADSFPHPFIRHFFISLPFSWSMLSVAAQSCLFPVFAKIKRGCLCGCMWCSLKLKDPLWSFLHVFRRQFFSHWHFAPPGYLENSF